MIRILTDSACDILPAEAQQLGVTVIPLNVTRWRTAPSCGTAST